MAKHKPDQTPADDMRLNKYIAHCGIASRRAAGELIKEGKVTVDGKVVTDIGFRVRPKQDVRFEGKKVNPVSRKVYYLINKPKDVITTVTDERGRRTIMDLVRHRIKERVYPVGRLDRHTTGLLLLTNDGDLTRKLSHPSFEVKKNYHVALDKRMSKRDLEKLVAGVELEDGLAKADAANYVEGKSHKEIGIELHSGKNRVIRRMMEHLGYNVEKLDRVYYAGLTKKDLPRGRFRSLTKQEVIMLKHFT